MAGEQPFVFARGHAAPGHHGQFLAGLELPEHRLDGLGADLVVVASAGMEQASPGAGGGRKPVQVQGALGSAGAAFAGFFGQRREQPQAVGVSAGKGFLADVTGIGEHGTQLQADPGLGSCWRQVSSRG